MEKCCCGKMISRIPTFETFAMLSFLKHHFLNPLKELLHDSKTIGIVLLCCTVVSLLLSNYSLTSINYIHFWNSSFVENHQQHLRIGIIQLPNSILQIINDFLMSIFFFAVAMEIKREILQGELASFKKSILPIVAAVGGMIIPAILYIQFKIILL
jgi:NhaA family Na+:H+ antiporter